MFLKYDGENRIVKKQNYNWGIAKRSRRGRLEIIAEILVFCDQRKVATSIMYKTNLNYGQLKSNLKLLTSQGFLMHDENKYVTTEKGYHFLKLFAQLSDILTVDI